MLHSDPPARERSAASESLSARQRRACGERAGRRDAEHAGSVTLASGTHTVGDAKIARLCRCPLEDGGMAATMSHRGRICGGEVDMTTTAAECSCRPNAPSSRAPTVRPAHRRRMSARRTRRHGRSGDRGALLRPRRPDAHGPGWDELTDVIASVPPLPGGSAITVEPGGAVELSGPPFDGPLRRDRRDARRPGRAARRVRPARAGAGPARRRSAAARQARQPR